MNNTEIEFSKGPYSPEGNRGMTEHTTLASMRDALTKGNIDVQTVQAINTLIERWRNDSNSVEPLAEMWRIVERARTLPRGDERVTIMNSIVKTLGQPNMLATFLDMVRDSATRNGTKEQELCRLKLQNVRMHSIYGWCGCTLLVDSDQPTEATYPPVPGLGERLGNTTSSWNLTINVWQPNAKAKGFPVNAVIDKNALIEPPHSHPFDFVSTVVKGSMHHSIYAQNDAAALPVANSNDRYGQTTLEHIDGVWPPHQFLESCTIRTLEPRVMLKAGDSYYMPCDWIHDVELDANTAVLEPTITLFFSSEYMVVPHAYVARSVVDFQVANPDIKSVGVPISENAWHEKLKALAAYLRGETATLELNEIVKHPSEYALLHVNS